MRKIEKYLLPVTLFSIVAAVAGCGGGSSSDELADDPAFTDSPLQVSVDIRTDDSQGTANSDVLFFWEQVEQYDFYRLLVNPDGRSGFTQVGPLISAETPDNDEGLQVFFSRKLTEDLGYQIVAFLFSWPDAIFMLNGCVGEPGDLECETIGIQTAKDLSVAAIDAFTTRSPDNQFQTTFGISVAISEDSLVAAMGANTATLFECREDEIIEVDGDAVNNCERQERPDCEAIPEGEEAPADCPDPDAPVFKLLTNAGAVYLYTRENVADSWQLTQIISASNADDGDNLGWSVSLNDDGSLLVAAAPGEDSPARNEPDSDDVESAGAVYVYERSGDQWQEVAFLKGGGAAVNDLFGWSTAIAGDGSVIAVGAVQKAACRGVAYTFEADGNGGWIQTALLTAPARQPNDVFGNSVTLDYSGATLAVGAPQFPTVSLQPACTEPANPRADAGAGIVHLYERTGSDWNHAASVTAANAEKADRFGWSVSLNANSQGDGRATRLLVGAPTESSGATGVNGPTGNDEITVASGAAYLFENQNGRWRQTQYLKASNTGATDQFGNAVSLTDSGTIAAIGAWGESGNGLGVNPLGAFDFATGSGAAYVFQEDATPGLWSEVAYVKPPFLSVFASFGWSIDTSEQSKALIVGAPGFRGGLGVSGSVFIY